MRAWRQWFHNLYMPLLSCANRMHSCAATWSTMRTQWQWFHELYMLLLSCAGRMHSHAATWSTMRTWRQCWWTCETSWPCATASCTSASSCWVRRRSPARWSDSITCCTSSSAAFTTSSTVCLSMPPVSRLISYSFISIFLPSFRKYALLSAVHSVMHLLCNILCSIDMILWTTGSYGP